MSALPKLLAALFAILVSSLACGTGQQTIEGRLEPLPLTTRPISYRFSVTPDAADSRFAAREIAKFEVMEATREVVVHSLGLRIESVRIDGAQEAQVSFDEKRERAIFRVAQLLRPGPHEMEVSYSGPIYGLDNQGIFKRTFTEADGTPGEALFTMLCCINTGRYFAPLWDQTADKAIFELDVTVAEGLDAFSNMPVASREPLEGGKLRVRFQPTPKMSTYLFFFAVGQFEQLRGRAGATDVGIVVRRGMGDRARYSLDTSMKVVAYYNDYFAFPFPLPKLDGIALSGTADFGGMENFGAIAYSEEHMLAGPGWSAPALLRDTYTLIAHEVSHQWFGDLVTAQTWDDLWLNEGFADWMQGKATEHFHPEWNIWMQDAAASRETAMGFDARAATYPIVPNHSFDSAITYNKSGQVIRMLEAYVGADAFRDAMRAQMRRRAFGNSVSSDIWEALEHASKRPVTAIGRDFTEQKGVPLIDVLSTRCVAESSRTQVVMRQDRFGLDAASRSRTLWHVPVTAAVAGSSEVSTQVISGPGLTTLEVAGCGPVKVNVGEVGYFRTRYDAESFKRLEDKIAQLTGADQLGLLNDTFALGEGGYVPLDRYLELASRVPATADPMVLFQIAQAAQKLDDYLADSSSREPFRVLARAKLAGVLAAMGWEARQDESLSTGVLRSRLIEALGQLGDPSTRQEAVRRLREADRDPALLPAHIRDPVLHVAGMAADDGVFRDLIRRAAAAGSIGEKKQLLAAAAGAQDADIARRALQLTLSGSVPDEAIADIALSVARSHPELAFDFVTSNLAALQPKLSDGAPDWLIPAIAANSADARLARRLDAFARAHFKAGGRHDVAAARSAILFRDGVRRERMGSIRAWLSRAHEER